jgi:hypothetical protein
MAQNAVAGNHLLGGGYVLVDVLDANRAKTGLKMIGNCEEVKTSAETEVDFKRDYTGAERGKIVEAVKSTSPKFSFVCDESAQRTLALHMFATEGTTAAIAGGTVTNEVIPVIALDTFIVTAKPAISIVSILPASGSTPFTVGTDYIIADAANGLIYIPVGSTMPPGANCRVSYTNAAVAARLNIALANAPLKECYVKFIGVPAKGPKINAEIWVVRFGGDGDFPLIQDAYTTVPIVGSILSDKANHPTTPYGYFEFQP